MTFFDFLNTVLEPDSTAGQSRRIHGSLYKTKIRSVLALYASKLAVAPVVLIWLRNCAIIPEVRDISRSQASMSLIISPLRVGLYSLGRGLRGLFLLERRLGREAVLIRQVV